MGGGRAKKRTRQQDWAVHSAAEWLDDIGQALARVIDLHSRRGAQKGGFRVKKKREMHIMEQARVQGHNGYLRRSLWGDSRKRGKAARRKGVTLV